MMRAWIGVALLAGAGPFAGGLYYPPNYGIAGLLVLAATVLLSGPVPRLVNPRSNGWAILLLLLPAVLVPWPYRAIAWLTIVGLLLVMLPFPLRWTRPWGRGIVAAGVILGVQALTFAGYAARTARSHDLPSPLPDLLAAIARLLGIDATADGSNVVLHSMQQIHRLGATWDLLLDPATLCFFAGGLVLWAMVAVDWNRWIHGLRVLTVILLAWLPVRAGLLMALYLHRVLRADPEHPLHVMNHFFAPWSLLILLIVPVLLAWRFIKLRPKDTPQIATTGRGFMARVPVLGSVLVGLAGAVWVLAATWSPVGPRREGRVMVVERHSDWEPSDLPYNTTVYGEKQSSYNYAVMFAYLDQYYQMSLLPKTGKIDDRTLENCDVLIIKTPTERYLPEEIEAVQRFVQNGGGLLLIGDHTNVFKSSTVINDIVRPMGFIFRDDLLFGNGQSPYDEHFDPPWPAHPALQNTPPLDFAVSCSIDPSSSRGETVFAGKGLWSMGPYYHTDNYHPVPQYCPEMRYGAFVQIWAAYVGRGRVLAFTDSTIFSNFSIFQPGKAELIRGMVEWLNHAGPLLRPGLPLSLLGLVLSLGGLWLARGRWEWWLALIASGALGGTLGAQSVAWMHHCAMPVPKMVHQPMPRVVIDRTTSRVALGKGPYAAEYAQLERWIPRLGYSTARRSGREVFEEDALVVVCPDRATSASFRRDLKRYVEEGGKLLVFDSSDNFDSTANDLLRPFGLSFSRKNAWTGTLEIADGWPNLKADNARQVDGGKPIAWIGGHPVAAEAKIGKGRVLAVGFASLFNDMNMGQDCLDDNPSPEQIQRYKTLYALLRRLVEGKAIVRPSGPDAALSPRDRPPGLPLPPSHLQPMQDLPGQESGPREESVENK
ncbi:MAG: hypothetical protein JXB10_07870 [Pirellulales bacterium]|nr:hypothetical protein [Pirellulales bacterium]